MSKRTTCGIFAVIHVANNTYFKEREDTKNDDVFPYQTIIDGS